MAVVELKNDWNQRKMLNIGGSVRPWSEGQDPSACCCMCIRHRKQDRCRCPPRRRERICLRRRLRCWDEKATLRESVDLDALKYEETTC